MKQETVIKIMLVLLISLLSFCFGTEVGKQVVKADARRLQIEQDLLDRESGR